MNKSKVNTVTPSRSHNRGLAYAEISDIREEIEAWSEDGFSVSAIYRHLIEKRKISDKYGFRTFSRAVKRVLSGMEQQEEDHKGTDALQGQAVARPGPSGLFPFAFGDALVRVQQDEQGEAWFVAKDVCRVLELKNVTEAVRGLEDDERGSVILNTPGGRQEMVTISESGLYALIFRSRKRQAIAFRRWVTSSVLPAIRRSGQYAALSLGELSRPGPRGVLGQGPELPPNAYVQILSCAVEAAKLENAGADSIDSYFERFCRMVFKGGVGGNSVFDCENVKDASDD